jgi:hypothetical protein
MACAEEGDETINGYAVQGEQTLGRIKDSQRAGSPAGRIVRRFASSFGAKRIRPDVFIDGPTAAFPDGQRLTIS